ncbi:MAG: flagellar hook basal-body protein [Cytophagia bacterium]|nr:flagellar hook basal-body protein [Cytophagia bacterium]
MSLYSSMNTALSGMNAQSRALGHISDNVANSQTVGFKRTDTSFVSYISESNADVHRPGTVLARPDFTNQVQGTIEQVENPLALAISGQGFFTAALPIGKNDDGSSRFDARNFGLERLEGSSVVELSHVHLIDHVVQTPRKIFIIRANRGSFIFKWDLLIWFCGSGLIPRIHNGIVIDGSFFVEQTTGGGEGSNRQGDEKQANGREPFCIGVKHTLSIENARYHQNYRISKWQYRCYCRTLRHGIE